MTDHLKERFGEEGLPGATAKFSIGEFDFYLHIATAPDGRVHFLAITCSGLHNHNIRSLMEVICRMATRALRRGAYTLDELCALWIGYDLNPWGICPQLLDYGYENPTAKSPLDAAAKILMAKKSKGEIQ